MEKFLSGYASRRVTEHTRNVSGIRARKTCRFNDNIKKYAPFNRNPVKITPVSKA